MEFSACTRDASAGEEPSDPGSPPPPQLAPTAHSNWCRAGPIPARADASGAARRRVRHGGGCQPAARLLRGPRAGARLGGASHGELLQQRVRAAVWLGRAAGLRAGRVGEVLYAGGRCWSGRAGLQATCP